MDKLRQAIKRLVNEVMGGGPWGILTEDERQIVINPLEGGPEADDFYNSGVYEKLFNYFLDSGDMPYGVAKARTGDPDVWILDQMAASR